MKRAALYLRVSTERQTVANQRPELVKLAKARGLTIVRTFEEQESAAKRRPAYEAMLMEAHRGEFDVVLVWSLDRFGRSALANLQAVLDLDAKGVRLVSARESWLDTQGPVRQLLIYILSWVAEQERARLIERTVAGMNRARAQGKHVGRPRRPVNLKIVRMLLDGGATRRQVCLSQSISMATLERALAAGREPSKGGAPGRGSKPAKSNAPPPSPHK